MKGFSKSFSYTRARGKLSANPFQPFHPGRLKAESAESEAMTGRILRVKNGDLRLIDEIRIVRLGRFYLTEKTVKALKTLRKSARQAQR